MTPEQAFLMMAEKMVRLAAGRPEGIPCRADIGTVKEVDESMGTCLVEREERPELYGVRLNAVIGGGNGDRFTVVPSVGSRVLVLTLGEETETVILATSGIEKVTAKTGDVTFEMSSSGIVMNGGGLGGMIDIAKLTEKVNGLVTAFNNHTHAVSTGGTATPPAGKATALSRGDYEDERIKH